MNWQEQEGYGISLIIEMTLKTLKLQHSVLIMHNHRKRHRLTKSSFEISRLFSRLSHPFPPEKALELDVTPVTFGGHLMMT